MDSGHLVKSNRVPSAGVVGLLTDPQNTATVVLDGGGPMRISGKVIALAWALLLLGSEAAMAHPFKCTSAITSNFNGTAIAAGDFVWFNGVTKVSGLSASPVTVFVTHATITFTANGKTYSLTVPDSEITFSTS